MLPCVCVNFFVHISLAMRSIFAIAFLLPVISSQIFENDLPVSLQPPPPPQSHPKSDFGFPAIQTLDASPPIPQLQPVQQLPPPQHLPPFQQLNQVPSIIDTKQIAHRTVLQSANQEAKLPPNLLNPFYQNPRIAEQLAKQSWFEPGENLVGDRDTEKVSREKIYYALKSAGLIRRKRYGIRY